MALASFLGLGFLIGMKHALEPDHLAAVATLAARDSNGTAALRQGVAWGLGHTLTLMLFGGVVLALGRNIPDRLAQVLDLMVGVMLIGLGADVLRRLPPLVSPSLADRAPHVEQPFLAHRRWPLRAALIGMMHGMAGSAAMILLSLHAVGSWVAGIAYILIFGAGSVLGMALLSILIALPMRATAGRLRWINSGLTVVVGGFSLLLGASVVYEVTVTEGLFWREAVLQSAYESSRAR